MIGRTPFVALARASLVLGACVALSGCVTVLPKQKAVRLYRLTTRAPSAASSAGRATNLILERLQAPSESAGDGILTVSGTEVAYLSTGRWAAPAESLVHDAFKADVSAIDSGVKWARAGDPVDFRMGVVLIRFDADLADARRPTITVTGQIEVRTAEGKLAQVCPVAVQDQAANATMSAVAKAFSQAVDDLATRATVCLSAVPRQP